MAETVTCQVEVLGIDPVRGAGRLLALANVLVDVAGVSLTLQGIRVMRTPGGGLTVEAPAFRHPSTGRLHPAVLLPPELRDAIGAEVLAAVTEKARHAQTA